jgi:acetyltransferase
MTARNLHFLLRPRSLAVIGASSRLQTVGGMVMRNLIEGGFRGRLMAVNRDSTALGGVAGYKEVWDLPETPDLAVICTPPDTLPGVVDDLGTRGVRAAAILTSTPDSPADSSGSQQQAILSAARPHVLRVLGPNSIGLLVPELGLNASFAPGSVQPGQIGFISQSSASTCAAMDWAAARDIGFSYVVSLGDAADVDAADMIEYLGADPGTRAILLYVESIVGARKFLSAARAASRAKPVVVLKSARTARGAQAVMHHTGCAPRDDPVFDAALRRAGMVRTRTIAELFAAGETLARERTAEGNRSSVRAARLVGDAGIPVDETPETAARAILHRAEYRRNQHTLQEAPPSALPDFVPDAAAAKELLRRAITERRPHLTEPEGKALLAIYGVPIVETYFAASAEAAVKLAAEIGYPVALKVASPELSHRSEVGGVMLNLENAGEVRRGAVEISRRMSQFRPDANLAGFTVQRMIRRQGTVHQRHGAHELTLTAVEDPVFGPVIFLGASGGDCAIGLVPLNAALARDMLHRCGFTHAADGAGRSSIDLDAAATAVSRVSQLLSDHPEIAQLAIEPLLADEKGVMALEVRTRVAPAQIGGTGRLAILPYPRHLERLVELEAGSFLVRPIRPEDAHAYSHFIARIDEADLRRRFAGPSGPLPESDLARYTQIDYDRDMVFVSVSRSGPGSGEIVGEVRAYHYPGAPTAELGIVVRSDRKRQGLGRALMESMIAYAKENGLELIGQIAPDNEAMITLAERCGMQVEHPPGAQVAVAHLSAQAQSERPAETH